MDKNKKLFPQRLWELIHDEKYNFCLRWSPDGQRVYLNRAEFELHYLKTPNNQFHTQKAISFVRQMNMYGFRKVDDCYYENDNFKRNCPHLLKNMVRRHSSKGFFSGSTSNTCSNQTSNLANQQQRSLTAHNHQQSSPPQPLSLPDPQDRRQIQSFYQQQQHQQASSGARASLDIGQQANQCLRDLGGSVGNLSAAMAAIGSNPTRSTLASTLYHRLAALNFSQPTNSAITNEQQQQQQQQMILQQAAKSAALISNATTMDAIPTLAASLGRNSLKNQAESVDRILAQTSISAQHQQYQSQQQQQQHQPQFDPLSSRESLATRQAIQQTIVRSLLQLKQPQISQPSPINLQHNLLASLHQHNPSLLLESLANFSSISMDPTPANADQADGSSPLELIVNPNPSSSLDANRMNEFSRSESNRMMLTTATDNASSILSSMGHSSHFNGLNLNLLQDQFDEEEDEDRIDDNDCPIDFEHEEYNNNNNNNSNNKNGSLLAAANSPSSSNHESSSRHSRDIEVSSDMALDLAKPTSTRSIGGRQKMPSL